MEPRTPSLYHVREGSAAASAFTPFHAVGIVCAAAATMLLAAIVAAQSGAPVMATAVVGQSMLFVVPLCVMRASGRSWAVLGLVRPRAARYWGAALMIGLSAWYLNLRLLELLPIRGEDSQLMQLIDRPSLPVVLVAVAVVPAICEEVLFRGVLVRGLATRFFPLAAIALGAAVFALYHLRVVQLVPTFTLGLLLGYVSLRADSALPGMLAHFTNNAVALVIARGDAPPVANMFGRYPALALAACTILTTVGLYIAGGWRAERRA